MRKALAATVVALATLAVPAHSQQQPIKLGVVNIEAGPLAVSAAAITEGATLAVETLNAAGGVLGRTYELVVQNHDGPPCVGGRRRPAARAAVGACRSSPA
jgi:branched-chain amino acid transport system substrate-binding protein